MNKNPLETAKLAQAVLEEKLGEDVKILDLNGLSNIADYFVIASGKNANHLKAMADEVETKLFEAGAKPHHIEGYQSALWILIDYGNVLVHLFNKEQRDFYSLERVWGDGKEV